MAVIVNGDGILTGVSSLTTALDDITSGRGTVTGVATVGTLQLGTGVSISSPRSQNVSIFTNDSEKLTVDDAGRVGIGTDNPDTLLHVKGSAAQEKLITLNNGNVLRNNYLGVTGADNLEIGVDEDNEGSSSSIRFRIDGSEKIRFHNAGRIGVNTDSPLAELHLVADNPNIEFNDTNTSNNGEITLDNTALRIEVDEDNSTASSKIDFRVDGSSKFNISDSGDFNVNGNVGRFDSGGLIKTANGSASTPSHTFINDPDNGMYRVTTNTIALATAGTERLRIDSSGRLRIASTTESADGAFDDLIIGNNSGNRGISILSANGQQGALGFGKSGTLADGYLAYVHQSTATDSYMTLKSSGTIRFHAASAEKIRIDDYGVLRVGNTHDQVTSGNTKRIALGAKGSIWGWATGQINGAINIADNYYWDGANNKAIESDYCAFLTLRSGSLRFGATANTQTGGSNISGGINEKVRFQQGGGISFNGDTAAANALDDYEEGVYTPTLTGSSSGGYSLNTSYNQLSYTKIGRIMHITGRVRVSSKNNPAGDYVKVTLPTTSASLGKDAGRVTGTAYVQSSGKAVNDFVVLPTTEGNSYFFIAHVDFDGTGFNNMNSQMNGDELISVNVTYVSA